jgi:hypothetical protein
LEEASGLTANAEEKPTVNLLWTGGWDSTFRLLSLVSKHDCTVQPYYVIDRDRKSWGIEVRTMEKVMTACRQDPSKYVGKILPPIFVEKQEIDEDPEITQAFRNLASRHHMGWQYEWLARLAKERGIEDLELLVNRYADPHVGSQVFLWPNVERRRGPVTEVYSLRRDVDEDLHTFRYFTFPVLHLTKPEMEALASEGGFRDVLEMTWFCLQPLNDTWPCGTCAACQYTIEGGMSRRIGWRGLLRHRARAWPRKLMPRRLRRALKARLRRASPRSA